MIDLSPLFQLDFWFRLDPVGLNTVFETAFFFLFAIFIILASVSLIIARQKKGDRFAVKAYKLLGQMFMTMGILGMLWFFFTFEEIYFLGARFWFLLWLVALIVWLIGIYRYIKIIVPEMKNHGKEKAEANKYLPRKK